MMKRVFQVYDGTHKTLFLQKAYKDFILSNGDAIDRVLRYYYKDAPPTINTMIRWAKHGLRPMPEERMPPIAWGTDWHDPASEDDLASVDKSKWREIYEQPEFWAKVSWRRLRRKCLKDGYDFNITWDDLIPPKICPVLGIEMKIGGGRSYESQKISPSVDRFDNGKGYVKGNVRIISKRANSLKSDATIKELYAVIRYMKSSS